MSLACHLTGRGNWSRHGRSFNCGIPGSNRTATIVLLERPDQTGPSGCTGMQKGFRNAAFRPGRHAAFEGAARTGEGTARTGVSPMHGRQKGKALMEYGADHAEFYDVVFQSRGKSFEGEAKKLAEIVWSKFPGAQSLLDVACGTAAHLETLAGLFEHVEGIDFSLDMLAIAKRKLPHVPLHSGDMRTFELERTFDAVTCMGNAVACMSTAEELETAIGRMACHLVSGGVLVVEPWFFPENFLDGHVGGHTVVEDGRVIARVTHSTRQGDKTRHEVRFVIADSNGICEFTEVLMVSLFRREQYAAAFEQAGCTAELVDGFSLGNGRPNSPGLFVGTRR
jgi:trans-aconitate methyltransferase